ncbi:hypothetical protein BD769DRAFT_479583 [Suillus cothurnatus]|nr:hypothetical protein BD769DRAFT_479583 [Suillus cothurnatus]
MMATKSEVFDDRKPIDVPPTYDEISSASLLDSVHSICRQPRLFSFLRKKQKRISILSSIRDIVSNPNITPSSITKIANACAATLTPVQFAHLLQEPNIEGHTALYWSIINHRRETCSALATFIPQFTSVCSSDLRLACIATSDHELFTQLNLGHVISPEDESLKKNLGCPPDEVQVHSATAHTPQERVCCFFPYQDVPETPARESNTEIRHGIHRKGTHMDVTILRSERDVVHRVYSF